MSDAPTSLYTHPRGPAERTLLGALESWAQERGHGDLQAADELIRNYASELAERIRQDHRFPTFLLPEEAADLIDPNKTELVFE